MPTYNEKKTLQDEISELRKEVLTVIDQKEQEIIELKKILKKLYEKNYEIHKKVKNKCKH